MYKITSMFRQQESFRNSPHSGLDFKMESGTPLRSLKDGIVEKVIDYGNVNAGRCIKVKFENGDTAIYGHLSKFSVKEGQQVHAGDLIGYSGNSGFSTGSHLHFGIKDGNGRIKDPSPYIEDIQNMNSPNYFVQHTPEVVNLKVNFFDYFQQHMNGVTDSLTNIKLNLIHSLSNDVLFIQIFEQVFQFFSAHASFLNHIITCIF